MKLPSGSGLRAAWAATASLLGPASAALADSDAGGAAVAFERVGDIPGALRVPGGHRIVPTFRRRRAENAGLNRLPGEDVQHPAEQVAWNHGGQGGVTGQKSKAHLAAAIRRVARHEPLQRQFVRSCPGRWSSAAASPASRPR